MTPTPVPGMTAAELVTAGNDLLTDLGLFPVIFAGAIIGITMFLLRRAKAGAR